MRSVVPALTLLAGCASMAPMRARIDELRARQQIESDRLDAIRHDIAVAQFEADRARRRAAFEECRATAAGVAATATVRVAVCQQETALHAECAAENQERTANDGVAGCIVGLLFAAISGGAAAPSALIGCGLGSAAGSASSVDCPVVACSADPRGAIAFVLKEQGLSEFPFCGGALGVQVSATPAQISSVVPGSAAASAGLLPGDVLVRIDGADVPTGPSLASAIAAHPPFETIRVGFVREGRYFEIPVTLGPPPRSLDAGVAP